MKHINKYFTGDKLLIQNKNTTNAIIPNTWSTLWVKEDPGVWINFYHSYPAKPGSIEQLTHWNKIPEMIRQGTMDRIIIFVRQEVDGFHKLGSIGVVLRCKTDPLLFFDYQEIFYGLCSYKFRTRLMALYLTATRRVGPLTTNWIETTMNGHVITSHIE